MMLLLILVTIFLILSWRNITFVIVFMPVAYVYFGHRNKCVKNISVLEDSENPESIIPYNTSLKKSFAKKVKHYIGSLMDYYSYRCAHTPSHHIRNFVYKHIMRMNLADDVVIYHGLEVREPSKISLGKGCIIGDNAILDGRNGIFLGENVVFASKVSIWTEQHDHRDPWFRCSTQKHNPVIIDDRVWIGYNVTILHGVHVGRGG